MKKLLSIFVLVVLCVFFAYSDEAEGAEQQPIVKGSATVQWGIDLGAGVNRNVASNGGAVPKHGFYNSNNIRIILPFTVSTELSGGSSNKDAKVYGSIDVESFGFAVGAGGGLRVDPKGLVADVSGVDARLVFYGAYLTVFDKPDFSMNFAKLWAPIKRTRGGFGDHFEPGFEGWGTKLGYSNEEMMNLDLGFKVGSNGSWDSKPADPSFDKKSGTHDSKYGFGFDLSMQPIEMMSLGFAINGISRAKDKTSNGGIVNPSDKGYNVTIEDEYGGGDNKFFLSVGGDISLKPMDGMSVTMGFDGAANHKYEAVVNGVKKDAWGFAWDLGLGLSYKWLDVALYATSKGTALHGWDDVNDIPDTENLAFHLGFNSAAGDKSTQLVEGLSLHAGLNFYDLLVKKADTVASDSLIRNQLMAYNAQISDKSIDYADLQADLSGWGIRQVPVGLNIGASYKYSITDAMWVKPYAEFYGETNHIGVHKSIYNKDPSSVPLKPYFGLAYELGATFSPVEKVEIDLNWKHGKLSPNRYEGGVDGGYMIEAPVNNNMHNGTFIMSLKVIY